MLTHFVIHLYAVEIFISFKETTFTYRFLLGLRYHQNYQKYLRLNNSPNQAVHSNIILFNVMQSISGPRA